MNYSSVFVTAVQTWSYCCCALFFCFSFFFLSLLFVLCKPKRNTPTSPTHAWLFKHIILDTLPRTFHAQYENIWKIKKCSQGNDCTGSCKLNWQVRLACGHNLALLVYPPGYLHMFLYLTLCWVQCLLLKPHNLAPFSPSSVPCWLETRERHHHPRCREEQSVFL